MTRQEGGRPAAPHGGALGLEPGQPGTPPEDEAQAAPWSREAVRWVMLRRTGWRRSRAAPRPEEGALEPGRRGEAAVALSAPSWVSAADVEPKYSVLSAGMAETGESCGIFLRKALVPGRGYGKIVPEA